MSRQEVEVPVHFETDGHVYRGEARFDAKWFHIHVSGRRIRTGGWDYELGVKDMGDDVSDRVKLGLPRSW